MKFFDWEFRPAIVEGGSAWSVLAPGEDWVEVNSAEVIDSGRVIRSERELREAFSRTFPNLPPLPRVPTRGVLQELQPFNGRKIIAGGAVFLFFGFLSLGIGVVRTAPLNASVLLNYERGTSASPPSIFAGSTDAVYISNLDEARSGKTKPILAKNVEAHTIEQVRQLQKFSEGSQAILKPDQTCTNADGFVQHGSWLWMMFVDLGLASSRWNENGDWTW
jgi:hypothetical protein